MEQLDPIDLLLVEDNARDAELIIRTLKQHNLANSLLLLEDGAEALDCIFHRGRFAQPEQSQTQSPKVILLDLKLPKLTGLEVLRVIKSNEQTRRIPVIIVTSSQEDPDIQTAYALGANSYVVKPVEFSAFQQVVSQLGFYWLLVNQPSR